MATSQYLVSPSNANLIKQSLVNLTEEGSNVRSIVPRKNHEFASVDALNCGNNSKIFSGGSRPSSPISSPSKRTSPPTSAKPALFGPSAEPSASSVSNSIATVNQESSNVPLESPKKSSWLQNIFRFKDDSRNVKSIHSTTEQTFKHVCKKLKAANVLFEQYKENGIKCKFDAIKFKVEISEIGDNIVNIRYTHQQGPVEQFNHLFELLKE